MRLRVLICCALLTCSVSVGAQPVSLIDVPFISQSEALCGGAAAAMVLRFWGATGLTAESFAALVDRSAAGIRTTVLQSELERRGWNALGVEAQSSAAITNELTQGRPVIALIQDRPRTYHYVVIVGWHERGVVLHDPARAPFRVMQVADFERRWSETGRWIMIVTPRGERRSDANVAVGDERSPGGDRTPAEGDLATTFREEPPSDVGDVSGTTNSSCDALIARGVREAQANQLDRAERSLTAALGCPGPAPLRELAGLRLLQRRWGEVIELASAATTRTPSDVYSWKLLGTARFIGDQTTEALRAWNRAGEPRIDLVRVDGLERTRQKPVEQLLALEPGAVLTAERLQRAEQALAELPAALTTGVTYVPGANGLAVVRASVVERSLLPRGWLPLAWNGVVAAATREIAVPVSSPSGGGERLTLGWRFWNERPRYAVQLDAPSAWGIWTVRGAVEQQAFSELAIRRAHRQTAEVALSKWAADRLRWSIGGGLDTWRETGHLAIARGGLTVLAGHRSDGKQVRLAIEGSSWVGDQSFGQVDAAVRVRVPFAAERMAILTSGAWSVVSETAPFDLWPAGDTGHVRATTLRAHPLLDGGRVRADRLAGALLSSSGEIQRWWRTGPLRLGVAAFADLARSSRRVAGPSLNDTDVGVGFRLRPGVVGGVLRIDAAKGLRDGATAVSFVYEP